MNEMVPKRKERAKNDRLNVEEFLIRMAPCLPVLPASFVALAVYHLAPDDAVLLLKDDVGIHACHEYTKLKHDKKTKMSFMSSGGDRKRSG